MLYIKWIALSLSLIITSYNVNELFINHIFVDSIATLSKLSFLGSPFKRIIRARNLAYSSPNCLFIRNHGLYTLNSVNISKCSHHTMSNNKVIDDPSLFKLQENPDFIKERLEIYERLYKIQQDKLSVEKKPINVRLHLNDEVLCIQGEGFKTTPFELISNIDKKLSKKFIVAQVKHDDTAVATGVESMAGVEDEEELSSHDGWSLWDLTRPLEGSCTIRLLDFNSDLGKHVFWHSSSHILGYAIEACYGGYLTIGPAIASGFYYDSYLGNNTFKPEDVELLLKCVDKLVISNKPFERLVCTKEEALELMKYNPFKVELINKKVSDNAFTQVYRCGDFIDLCKGPHIPFTSFVKTNAFDITKISSSYWLSNSNGDVLQRVYGISFPEKDMLKEYNKLIAEAKERDHRVIGTNLNLFYFDHINSPGSCFWLPNGAKIYNRLVDFLRENYRKRGYQEVITPNIYSCDLWKSSGHYENYKDNMYTFTTNDNVEWGMKPMNCPGHCLMFKHMNLSYRNLPLRLADFGVLHRNELAGSLSGLTRVRRFQQDDAHIFCTQEQIQGEVLDIIDFVSSVYSLFNFRYEFKLSTKPSKALGDDNLWNCAESALEEALNKSGHKWSLNEGDGAFYGPKIDILLFDCLNREHQCGTIQLDFNLPIRFNLEYRDKSFTEDVPDQQVVSSGKLRNGYSRPVIVHRAILGSIERFIAIVLEQTKGKLPFWLSPTQILIIPISNKHSDYANELYHLFNEKGYNVGVDDSTNTINKKIKVGQGQRWNYMAIVGDREKETRTISIRPLDTNDQVVYSVEDFLDLIHTESNKYKL